MVLSCMFKTQTIRVLHTRASHGYRWTSFGARYNLKFCIVPCLMVLMQDVCVDVTVLWRWVMWRARLLRITPCLLYLGLSQVRADLFFLETLLGKKKIALPLDRINRALRRLPIEYSSDSCRSGRGRWFLSTSAPCSSALLFELLFNN